MKLRLHNSFIRFWMASTTSYFGTYITSLALQVLVVVNLHGTAADVGWINASRWLPYVFLGLFAGLLIDRINRKLVLVITDIARAILLTLICLTAIFNVINIGWLIVIMITFGTMSIFHDAAYQSFVPEIVPRPLLIRANARLEQSAAVAETSGPAISGGLIAWIGAPFTILINAFTYFSSGILMASIKNQTQENPKVNVVKGQIKEGLRWVYKHQYLRSLALNTHIWFFFHSMTITVLVTYVLMDLQFSSMMLGFVLAAAGVGAVCGTSLSMRLGARYGIGKRIAFSRSLYSPAVILIVLAPAGQQDEFQVIALCIVLAGQLLYGFAMGMEGPLETGYRQSITPMRLQEERMPRCDRLIAV